jgi:thiamine-phosphate pyrophosphorylase
LSFETESAHGREAKAPVVCYVTDRKGLAAADAPMDLTSSIRRAIAAGVDWVQIREKDLPSRDMLALAKAAVGVSQEFATGSAAARVLINDRLDVALASGASGVHLGSASIPVEEVVRWCRAGNTQPAFLIGVSCHSVEEARRAEAAGANYVFFGPIFETPSKKAFGPPQGTTRLREVCASVGIAVIAIGGVDVENAAECLRAGAAGVAAIRLFQGKETAEAVARRVSKLHQLSAASMR